MRTISTLLFVFLLAHIYGQKNMVLVTLDGLRWEELFGGAVDTMMNDKLYVDDTTTIIKKYGGKDGFEKRKKLMPWLWSELEENGQIYGNRLLGNKMDCKNRYWFSYPGYNEILTGYPDTLVDSNAKVYNENVTVLEWLNNQDHYKGKVAAFSSWDVFPYIVNDLRSGIPVNAAFTGSKEDNLTVKEQMMNTLLRDLPPAFGGVRFDALTFHYAFEYMKTRKPKVLYIAFDETDDYAHQGKYDRYLNSTHQTDKWLKELWTHIQNNEFYKDNTYLVITTDHGRGSNPKNEWRSHGADISGASSIWLAVMGPGIIGLGEIGNDQQHFQNQIASTCASLLGFKFEVKGQDIGEDIKVIASKN